MVKKRNTREISVRNIKIGNNRPIVIQSMAATKTTDTKRTIAQINALDKAGAGIVRLAIDSKKDCEALAIIRDKTQVPLSADLQENYRLVKDIAPYIDKVRYNPGHLHHHEKTKSIKSKVLGTTATPSSPTSYLYPLAYVVALCIPGTYRL
mgnify:CR=1 FL=1